MGSREIRIVVLQRGWVVVGNYRKDGSEVVVSGGGVIRRWGTTKGLGEIATGGPTDSTIIDRTPEIRAHELAVVMTIAVDPTKWGGYVVG